METTELRQFILPLRRWWWLLILATALAAGSSFWLVGQQPDRFWSRASVMVGGSIQDPNPENNQFFLAQQLANTYADLIQRDSVRAAAMETLNLSSLPPYDVRVVPNTQLLELTVTDTDPMRAQAVAAELVRQLIRVSPAGNAQQERQEWVEQELDELQVSIDETKAEIEASQAALATFFSARQIANTENQIAALQTKLTALQTNYTNLLATTQQGAVNAINIIEEPSLGVPIRANPWINIILAAAVGLVLAAGGAYLIEYFDDSLKNPDDVSKHLAGLSTIGAVPVVAASDLKNGELVMLEHGHAPVSESFRILRTNLQYASVAHELKRILITSASLSEGKSFICANLAVAMAQTGRRVVLIDADMHRPRQHKVWHMSNIMGLSTTLLTDPARVEQFLQATELPNLHVLTTGPLPPNPSELLGSDRMRDLMRRLGEQYDTILIDSPPATAVADTAVASKLADGVILVISAGKTGREMAKRALNALWQVNAHMAGVVLNRLPSRKGDSRYYFNYNYGFYSTYYRRDDDIDMRTVQAKAVNPLLRHSTARSSNGADKAHVAQRAADSGSAVPESDNQTSG